MLQFTLPPGGHLPDRKAAGADGRHRTYRDAVNPGAASIQIACAPADDGTLVTLARAASRIEVREAGAAPRVLSPDGKALLEALQALRSLPPGEACGDMHRQLRRRVIDRRARLLVKHNRHLLVGSGMLPDDGSSNEVLLLVVTRVEVRSCDWLLAA
jgi:hypothetical protein